MSRLPTGGPIAPHDPAFLRQNLVERIADAILRGGDINLVGGWQTGKTTALYGLRVWGADHGWASSYLDLSPWALDVDDQTWYELLAYQVAKALLPEAGSSNFGELRDHTNLANFFVSVVDAIRPLERFVLMLDEVTAVPKSVQKSFFSAIRSIQNQRLEPGAPTEFRAVNFVFAGSFSPDSLISDSHNSPFNISKTFNTTNSDFTAEQILELVRLTEADIETDEVLGWTSGHPYLTNALIEAAAEGEVTLGEAAHRLVTSDRHFANLGRALSSSGAATIKLAFKIAAGERHPFVPGIDESTDRLLTFGLVRANSEGDTEIRCRLYGLYLDRARTAGLSPATDEDEGTGERSPARAAIDVAILVALPKELDAILALADDWTTYTPDEQPHRTYHSRSTKSGKRIVAVRAIAKGPKHAMMLVRDVLEVYNPRFVILTGIAGGIAESDLGDVVVSDQVIDYEPGKVVSGGVEARHQVYRSSNELLDKVQSKRDESWISRVGIARPDGSSKAPRVIIGDVLSGEKVFADHDQLKELTKHWTTARAIEMESSGAVSALQGRRNPPGFIMIKGVSDKADSKKDNVWHQYAAATAAVFTLQLVEEL